MILILTKLFLEESKKYHRIKDNKTEITGNHELKNLVLREIETTFD